MIDEERRAKKREDKERTRKRMRVEVDPDNYEFIPAKKQIDYYDDEVQQRVAIYVRVSTDDVRQTTSFELQKKYYEDFVSKHPNWTLVEIYADEGISGTSLAHRDAFNRMIADCRAGKIDMIITKSVSRFARNVMITIGFVRELAEMKHPVGVFFESECIFSLNDDSAMALSFLATMAEEESHTRSRSMETSLRMRLDNGIPLTPKLLGYTHDTDGNLVINPSEAPTVKLVFYMYLYGYSSQQIADALNALERKSYLGNVNWTSGGVVQILRNERHCGDVLTRKTFTPNFRDHKSRKNCGDRPQSRYLNHHEAIVSRDDFIAVQQMIDNAKYKNTSFLPKLHVIDRGVLKGFVVVHPRWAAFKCGDYYKASQSVYPELAEHDYVMPHKTEVKVEVEPGDFDMRGFEVARSELFDTASTPAVTFAERSIKFNMACVKRLGDKNYIELLVNPITQKFAIRPTKKDNRHGVFCSKHIGKRIDTKEIPTAAFSDTIFDIFGWNRDCKYRITGSFLEQDGEVAYIFDTANTQAFFKPYVLPTKDGADNATVIQPFTPIGKHIRAIPQDWTSSFGKQYYLHEQTLAELDGQSKSDWLLRLEGQLFETGKRLNVTSFEELRRYIKQELSDVNIAGGT